jgi:hypothetical protein
VLVGLALASTSTALAQAPVKPSTTAAPARAAECEPCEDEDDRSEGSGMFNLGFGVFDLSSLNDRLAAGGYERLSNRMTLLGGEGHALLESGFVIGGRGAALLGDDGRGPGTLQTELSGGFGMLDLGFALVRTDTVLFTVLGGFGGYGWSLLLSEREALRFEEVLETPERTSSLSRGGVLVGLTLGIDGRVPIGKPERGKRGFFTLGARVGGLFGPALGDWSATDGTEVTAGPDTGLAGLYGLLALGFGGGPASLSSPP